MRKSLAAIGTVAALGAGAGLTVADLSTENIREEAARYETVLEDAKTRLTLSKDEEQATNEVRALVERRATLKNILTRESDEPTDEEWQEVETRIDELRARNDSEYLQKLDRFIERMDAKNKTIRDEAAQTITDL